MSIPLPLQFLLVTVAGWLHREQAAVIEYLKAELAVYRELLGGRAPRLTVEQRRRLATKGRRSAAPASPSTPRS